MSFTWSPVTVSDRLLVPFASTRSANKARNATCTGTDWLLMFGQRITQNERTLGLRNPSLHCFPRCFVILLLLVLPGAVRGQFIYTITDGTASIIMYTGGDGDVVIPGTLDGLPVITIGGYKGQWGFWHGAFEGRSGVTGVTIPNSVTTIGSRAFNSCLSLTSVTIPNSVISIESASFAYCYSLTNVTIPDSVSSIGVGAFYESGLTAVYFRGNCPTPSDNLFQDASMAIVYYLPGTAGWAATLAGRPTALWVLPYPFILTRSVGRPQSNGFGFRISWATNVSVVVETATGGLGSNWAPISTNALINGWVDFSDPEWTNYPSRFYRIRSP